MKAIGGLLAGVVAGFLAQALLVYAASLVIQMPAVNSTERVEIAQAFADSTAAALLVNIFSYFLAALVAAWVGGAIGGRNRVAWAAGLVVALLALVIAVFFPEPAWAQFGAFIAAVIGATVGKHLGDRRPARAESGAGADAHA